MIPLRIVLLMIEPPLPFGNAAARWFYVLMKELVARGHTVKAFAVCSKPSDLELARDLFPSPEYDLRLFELPQRSGLKAKLETLRRPYSYLFSPELKAEFRSALAEGFDILHLEQLWAGWLGLEHRDRALVNVYHMVGIDLAESKPKSVREFFERELMFRTERRLLKEFTNIRACSPRLASEIQAINPKATVTSVPVGLDSSLYSYIPDDRRTREPILTLIGTMGWYPGYSAAIRLLTRLWPSIKAQVPDAKLQIVGWSAREKLAEYVHLPDVSIHENVPDIQPYFERTGVLLYAPSRGSGMKVKVLEAMAFGIPFVTTSEGVEGIPAQDGIHGGICEDDAGLIERTVTLLRDTERQNRQRQAARVLLETHCGPAPTVDAIEAIYSRMLGN